MSDLVEHPQGSKFPGVIGRTVHESSPAWPAPTRANDGAPKGLSCGFDFGAPAAEYDPPFPFTGTIRQVAVDLAGELISDDEAELRLLMARQ